MDTMVRPVLIPFRWLGHLDARGRGIDVRACVADGEALFVAADIATALDLPLEYFDDAFMGTHEPIYPLPTTVIDGVDEELFTVPQVIELANDRPMHLVDPADDFASWIEELVGDHLTGDRLESTVTAASHPEPGLLAPRTFSVAHAARILSRDPLIDLGERSLFASMQSFAWIARDVTYTWVPAEGPLRDGYLIRQKVRVPGRKNLYPQIRITPEGLHALHKRLGGLNYLDLDETPHLTLVELP